MPSIFKILVNCFSFFKSQKKAGKQQFEKPLYFPGQQLLIIWRQNYYTYQFMSSPYIKKWQKFACYTVLGTSLLLEAIESPQMFLHKPGNGYWVVKASTLLCKFNTLSIKGNSGEVTNFKKSWSFEPETNFLASRVICTPSLMKSATVTNSFSEKPRVVIAGEPMRIPPGTSALLSPTVSLMV